LWLFGFLYKKGKGVFRKRIQSLSPPKWISDKRLCKITLFLKFSLVFGQKKSFFCFSEIEICLQPCGIYQKKALSAELKAFFFGGLCLE